MYNESILPEGFSPETPLFPQQEEEVKEETAVEEDPIEAQNAAAAAKAPVRGVSGSSFAGPDEEGDFERGFDSADRW